LAAGVPAIEPGWIFAATGGGSPVTIFFASDEDPSHPGAVMKTITACTMDCPDACSLLVWQDAAGQIKIRGNPDHPFTAGFTCAKIKRLPRRLRHPQRIVSPMMRSANHWKKISWDDALDLCAEKIDRLRPEPAAILHIHGEGAKGVLKQANKLFFALLGATERIRESGPDGRADGCGFAVEQRDPQNRQPGRYDQRHGSTLRQSHTADLHQPL
jgi:anaerobic selenocysteine-containing dehydrogenase